MTDARSISPSRNPRRAHHRPTTRGLETGVVNDSMASPAQAGERRRHKPLPHHRPRSSPMSDVLDAAPDRLGVFVAVERVPTRGIRDQLVRILQDMLRKPVAPVQGT